VKKLLTILIMLVIGMALFAVPVTAEPGVISAMNTVEAAPQFAGVFATVTDISPAIMPAESLCYNENTIEVFVTNSFIYWYESCNCLTQKEANPFYRCSKTAASNINYSLIPVPINRRV
jgi:hypothetical protein